VDSTGHAFYVRALTGPVFALLVVALVLTRTRVLARVRTASWMGIVGCWVVAFLPWVLAWLVPTRAPIILLRSTTPIAQGAILIARILVPLVLLAPLMFAVGATGVWMGARVLTTWRRGFGAGGA
jgi:hypothetical protein